LKLPHAPDWLAYLAVAAALAVLAVGVPWRIGKEVRPRLATSAVNGQALAPASLFDPAIWVSAPPAGPGAGTAFSVAESGVWLTARHVVDGCASTVIITSPGHGVAARARLWPGRETAVLYTRGGAPALPIAPAEGLRRGQRAFHPGFPGSRPGEARSELARRATLWVGGHGLRAEPVLSFVETGRSPAVRGALTGLSGAPALDARGRVLGVTVAEAPRRRRLYATTPSSVRATLAQAGVRPLDGPGQAMTAASYGAVADDLRARLSVAEVECLGS
jgi:S1-C subfamily serine protease